MSKRLTQIATRTGDNGTTGLGDNTRVSKDSLRVHAMGDVDELNSNIGVLLCEDMPGEVRALLVDVQHQLFNLGGELSIPGFELLKPEAVGQLDDLARGAGIAAKVAQQDLDDTRGEGLARGGALGAQAHQAVLEPRACAVAEGDDDAQEGGAAHAWGLTRASSSAASCRAVSGEE